MPEGLSPPALGRFALYFRLPGWVLPCAKYTLPICWPVVTQLLVVECNQVLFCYAITFSDLGNYLGRLQFHMAPQSYSDHAVDYPVSAKTPRTFTRRPHIGMVGQRQKILSLFKTILPEITANQVRLTQLSMTKDITIKHRNKIYWHYLTFCGLSMNVWNGYWQL